MGIPQQAKILASCEMVLLASIDHKLSGGMMDNHQLHRYIESYLLDRYAS
jgi:hypothetical protein